MSHSVIPADTELHAALRRAADESDCVVLAGLPGIGKSLLTLEVSLAARATGRAIFVLQWDVVRRPFEAEPYRTLYPEHDGIANPTVRIAVDHWLRAGIARWRTHAASNALLIIEAPLIGCRLSSLTRPRNDAAEPMLASPRTLFLLPVPTVAVKDALRLRRNASMAADPGQPDAKVHVLDAHVEQINLAAAALGLAPARMRGYNPAVYSAVYRHAMRHRHFRELVIEQVFDVPAVLPQVVVSRIEADAEEVAVAFAFSAAMPQADQDRQLAEWFH